MIEKPPKLKDVEMMCKSSDVRRMLLERIEYAEQNIKQILQSAMLLMDEKEIGWEMWHSRMKIHISSLSELNDRAYEDAKIMEEK